jgi:hypothetical protein
MIRGIAIQVGYEHSILLADVRAGSSKGAEYVSKYISKSAGALWAVPWRARVVNIETGEVTRRLVKARYRTWSASRRWGITMRSCELRQQSGHAPRRTLRSRSRWPWSWRPSAEHRSRPLSRFRCPLKRTLHVRRPRSRVRNTARPTLRWNTSRPLTGPGGRAISSSRGQRGHHNATAGASRKPRPGACRKRSGRRRTDRPGPRLGREAALFSFLRATPQSGRTVTEPSRPCAWRAGALSLLAPTTRPPIERETT